MLFNLHFDITITAYVRECSKAMTTFLHTISPHLKSVHLFSRNPKFVCEDCPYTNNNRNEFWRHRKGHFERGIVPSDLKCQHCPYWAEDKRDWHLHCSLHGGM